MEKKLTVTATSIHKKLNQEIEKVIAKYNEISEPEDRIVFVEISGKYSLSTLKYNENGDVTGHHKIGIDSLREMLSYCAQWRTRSYGDPELGWIVQRGGYCPDWIARYAARRPKPEDMPKVPVYSYSQVFGVYSKTWRGDM